MALGEKVVFDIDRVYLSFIDDNSIGITCESQEEVNEALNVLKKNNRRIKF